MFRGVRFERRKVTTHIHRPCGGRETHIKRNQKKKKKEPSLVSILVKFTTFPRDEVIGQPNACVPSLALLLHESGQASKYLFELADILDHDGGRGFCIMDVSCCNRYV